MQTDADSQLHYSEVVSESGAPGWGWQCFTCGSECIGGMTFPEAERASEAHDLRAA